MCDPSSVFPPVTAEAALESYDRYIEVTTIDDLTEALKQIASFGQRADLTESGATIAADLAKDALRRRAPFSLVRIGDGEGNILAAFEPDFRPARDYSTRDILTMMFGTAEFPAGEIARIRQDMMEALVSADVLGVSDWFRVGRLDLLRQSSEGRADIRGYMGSYESIFHVAKQLDKAQRRPAQIVSNHIHRHMMNAYASIVAEADEVVLVGPYDLGDSFRRAFAKRRVRSLIIPNQASSTPGEGSKWFPHGYQHLLSQIQTGPGVLVLIAGGLLGKALCRHAQLQGAVAIDIGSVIDVWRGKAVRNYHDGAFIDRFRITEG